MSTTQRNTIQFRNLHVNQIQKNEQYYELFDDSSPKPSLNANLIKILEQESLSCKDLELIISSWIRDRQIVSQLNDLWSLISSYCESPNAAKRRIFFDCILGNEDDHGRTFKIAFKYNEFYFNNGVDLNSEPCGRSRVLTFYLDGIFRYKCSAFGGFDLKQWERPQIGIWTPHWNNEDEFEKITTVAYAADAQSTDKQQIHQDWKHSFLDGRWNFRDLNLFLADKPSLD